MKPMLKIIDGIVIYKDESYTVAAGPRDDYNARIGELVEDLLVLGIEAISDDDYAEDFVIRAWRNDND